jgi:hypothetical protein
MRSHRAHLIVSTFGDAPSLRSVQAVTAVVGGLIDAVAGCSAVMWCGRVVRSAAQWSEQSRAAFAAGPDYPLLLWVDIMPIRTATGMDAITIGLAPFIGREVEFEAGGLSPPQVLNKTMGLATYLVEHGDVMNDGDTFGASEAEQIRISHDTSRRFKDLPVLRAVAAQR